jgi:DNA uptake protein ComE-like DNA-binding protein
VIHRPKRENRVAYALLVLGIASLLLDVVGSDYLGNETAPNSGKCLYQIFIGDEPAACLFLDEPAEAAAVLRAANFTAPESFDNSPIPCDHCIKITSDRITVGKISGALLIAMGRPIDLNLADEQDLIAIPGVGPKLAARILDFRKGHGEFSETKELIGVRGIGKKKFAAIAPYVHVTESKNAKRSLDK